MQKLEKYEDVKDLAEDVQKNLDALATGLQKRIHVLYNKLHGRNPFDLPRDACEYRVRSAQIDYEIEGLANALERLNRYFKNFKTNYEYIEGYIAEHDTKPVRKDQREE